ncbi:MAG TPA: hypothetical protein VE733_07475 [Streptosporangiaceae bacterium]|jgi:hypothetical protein|nr:hypothetical protein [Streptosporangiaceae bacterium]
MKLPTTHLLAFDDASGLIADHTSPAARTSRSASTGNPLEVWTLPVS